MPPTRPDADHRLRSFTPGGVEVLGAGHNAMGAWIWLAQTGRLPADRSTFAQEIGDDVLPVRVERPADGAARVAMRQSPPRFLGRPGRADELERVLGLAPGAVRRDVEAQVVSTGAGHLLVPVVRATAVDGAVPVPGDLRAFLAAAGAEGCYVFALTPERDDVTASARFFNPTVGIAEDPATGTAAGPLAALLVRLGLVEGTTMRIEQGRTMGRPSVLDVLVDGDVVELSGSGVLSAGHLELPDDAA